MCIRDRFEWVRQALKLNRAIMNPSACAEVETPVLLFQSGRDIWVLNKPQNHFVQLVKDGGGEANIVRFPESRHEIFSMPNSTYKPYLEKILGFYDDPDVYKRQVVKRRILACGYLSSKVVAPMRTGIRAGRMVGRLMRCWLTTVPLVEFRSSMAHCPERVSR